MLYCQDCGAYLGCSTGVLERCASCGWEQPEDDSDRQRYYCGEESCDCDML